MCPNLSTITNPALISVNQDNALGWVQFLLAVNGHLRWRPWNLRSRLVLASLEALVQVKLIFSALVPAQVDCTLSSPSDFDMFTLVGKPVQIPVADFSVQQQLGTWHFLHYATSLLPGSF